LKATFAERRCCYEKPASLKWATDRSPKLAVSDLINDIRDVCGAATDELFDQDLAAGQKRRAFAVRIDTAIRPPTQEIFDEFVKWWSSRAQCEGGPATLLLLVVEPSEDPEPCPKSAAITDIVENLFSDPDRFLPRPVRCDESHIKAWKEEKLKDVASPYHEKIANRLVDAVKGHKKYANEAPLNVIRSALY
jgi:hypothetical protein